MTDFRLCLRGLWLPLITPFLDGELDDASLRRLVQHYAALPVSGMILTATTGEGLTLAPEETARLVAIVHDEVGNSNERLPVCLGLSGSDTRAMLDTLRRTAAWPIDGYLISCPYYSRPTQNAMVRHFIKLADQAAHPVMIYNIPYRTGVNLGNEAMLQLADHPNIVGLKDCCAIRAQSVELLRRRPPRFAVLTGEDAQTYDALADGADGAILASAHVETDIFASIVELLAAGDRDAALNRWRTVYDLTTLLFSEPSPAPIKHWLWRTGLIDSPELRLPMTQVSSELAAQLDRAIAARASAAAPATIAAHCR